MATPAASISPSSLVATGAGRIFKASGTPGTAATKRNHAQNEYLLHQFPVHFNLHLELLSDQQLDLRLVTYFISFGFHSELPTGALQGSEEIPF